MSGSNVTERGGKHPPSAVPGEKSPVLLGLKLSGHTKFVLCKKYQGYFQLSYNLVHSNKRCQRFDFENKRQIIGVDSLTGLKTCIFQDHQNI